MSAQQKRIKSREAKVFDREERILRFGIECGDELLWGGGTWTPGGEYCKVLVVKNVGGETVKMKYKPPDTQYFSMDFPDLVTLSPGMSFQVQVVFRPVHVEPYDDFIQIFIKKPKQKSSFFIPIRARLSEVSVDIPQSIDFGFCPIAELSTKKFEVLNTGQIPVEYNWQVSEPFEIVPARGEITDRQTFEVRFLPTKVCVLVSQALFHAKGLANTPVPFKLSGISKYPFVALSEERIDFGEVFAGSTKDKEIVLRNQSFVSATFSISRIENDLPAVHSIVPTKGVIEPGQLVALRIKYTPRSLGQFSCDTFLIKTPGGNSTTLECVGTCVGPKVYAGRMVSKTGVASEGNGEDGNNGEQNVIQFGDVPFAHPEDDDEGVVSPTRVLYITNVSQQTVRYQFLTDPNSEFQFLESSQGIISAQVEKTITVRFKPRRSGNFFKRVFCIFQDQMPIYFDLIGTAFDGSFGEKKNRPQPLLYRHVVTHRARELRGLERETPNKLLELDDRSQSTEGIEFPETITELSCSGGATRGQLEVFSQVFKPANDPSNVISLGEEYVDFGAGSRLRASSDKKVIHITNRHRAKVVCAWSINFPEEYNVGKQMAPFAIFPESQDIGPGETAEFRVLFQPQNDNLYYNVTASAFVHLKTNRTFRLVNDKAFVPPWHISVRLMGHTFQEGSAHFLPKVRFLTHVKESGILDNEQNSGSNNQEDDADGAESGYSHSIEFPVCHLGESVYQTFVIENTGDTPAKFNFSSDPLGRFQVVPSCGLIQKGEFQLISLKATPQAEGEHRFRLKCMLNNSGENTHSVSLQCHCSLPKVMFEDEVSPIKDHTVASPQDTMFVKPTCVGLTTKRKYVLRNVSRVPIRFEWRIPKRFRSILKVFPPSGTLRGNESATLTWSFSPKLATSHAIDTVLFARSTSKRTGIAKEIRRVLTVCAQGSNSCVSLEKSELHMGTILSNDESVKTFSITNHVDCDVQFRLKLEKNDLGYLSLSMYEGCVGAKSTISIKVKFHPETCGDYEYVIRCQCLNGNVGEENSTGTDLTLSVQGTAASPTLVVEDARCHNNSTLCLWKQFDISRLNSILEAPVTDAERKFAKSTGVKSTGADSVNAKDMLECVSARFLPATHGSPTQNIAFQLKNGGKLPVAFNFKFPNDSDIEIEPWADAKEPCEEEVRQAFLLDNKVFEIQPRDGLLGPGEASIVRMSYKHSLLQYNGEHRMEVLFSMRHGHQIRVLIEGRTLAPGIPKLFPYNQVYTFTPTRIGLNHPPVREVEFFNPGLIGMEYVLDPKSLTQICADNFNYPVIQCLNPTGYIPTGRFSLQLVFNPLEHKLYSCDLKIKATYPSNTFKEEEEAKSPVEPDEDVGMVVEYVTIRVQGQGYHPSAGFTRIPPQLMPPKQQLLPLSGQIASLSLDVIEFGNLISGAVVSRICYVRNLSALPLSFIWDQDHPLAAQGVISIQPASGEIKPGSFTICKFSCWNRKGAPLKDIYSDICCDILPPRQGTDNDASSIYTSSQRSGTRTESRASTSYRERTRTRGYGTNQPVRPENSTFLQQNTSVVDRSTASRDYRISSGRHDRQTASLLSPEGSRRHEEEEFAARSICSTSLSTASPLTTSGATSGAPASLVQKQTLFTTLQATLVHTSDAVDADPTDFYVPALDDEEGNGENVPEQDVPSETLETILRDTVRDPTVVDTLDKMVSNQTNPLFLDFFLDEIKEPVREDQGSYGYANNLRNEMVEQQRLEALRIPECQLVIEEVVETSLLNLIHESSHGEIDLSSFTTFLYAKDGA